MYKDTVKQQIDYYNKSYAEGYPFTHPSPTYRTIYSIFMDERIRFILEHLPQDASILDVGCGRGDITKIVAAQAKKIIGLEVCDEAVKKARDENNMPNVEYVCLPIEEYVPTHEFDAILMIDIIEHVHDFRSILASIKASLKRQGVLIISTPNSKRLVNRFPFKNLKAVLKKLLKHKENGAKCKTTTVDAHTHEYDIKELKALLRENGFQVKKVRGLILFDIFEKLLGTNKILHKLNFRAGYALPAVAANLLLIAEKQ